MSYGTESPMRCGNPGCQEEVPGHERSCLVCGRDAGYPNVRAAATREEVKAVDNRFQAAQASSKSGGYHDELLRFEDAVSRSQAVICRHLSTVHTLVSSDNELFSTYYNQVTANMRIPEDNEWDRAREALESAVFPHYHREISYGVLSLDGVGQTAYGPVSIALKESSISDRASVFDEPLFPFFRSRKILAGQAPPLGHRATWEHRGRLAAAKLHSALDQGTKPSEYQDILLSPQSDPEGDCIEAHIYGPIHRRAISGVIAKIPTRRADKAILESVKRKLQEIGVKVRLLK